MQINNRFMTVNAMAVIPALGAASNRAFKAHMKYPQLRWGIFIDDFLAEEPQKIKAEYSELKNVPVCISLREHNLIGVIG